MLLIIFVILLFLLMFLNFTYSDEENEFFASLCVGEKLKKKSNGKAGTIIHIYSKQNIELETNEGYITCDLHKLYDDWEHVLISTTRNYDMKF